jgi:hypothetical protein
VLRAVFAALIWILPFTLWAGSLADEKELLRAAAVQVLIREMGLRESDTPVSELPGWSRPEKVLVRLDRPQRLAGLQAAAPGVEIVPVSSVDEATSLAADA